MKKKILEMLWNNRFSIIGSIFTTVGIGFTVHDINMNVKKRTIEKCNDALLEINNIIDNNNPNC